MHTSDKTIHKILYLLGESRRRRWILVVLLAVLVSLLEAVGAALVLLLLRMISDPEVGMTVPVLGDLRLLAGGMSDRSVLLFSVAAIGVFFVTRAGFRILQTYVQLRVVHNAGSRLATKLVRGYLEMPYMWHLRHNSASLIRNAHQAVNRMINQVFLPSIRVVAESLLLLMMLSVLFVASPTATLLAIGVVGPTVLVLMRVVQPALKRLGQTTHETVRRYFSTMQESFTGIRDVKIFGREPYFTRKFARDRSQYARASYLQGTAADLPRTVMELSLLLVILAFFAFAVDRGESAASILPTLGLFAYAGLRLQPSLQKIIQGTNSVRFATAAIDELYAELEELESSGALEVSERARPLPFAREIIVGDASFQYEETDRPALTGIDLRIRRGESIGICGPTGGGKTTLVDVLVGLLDPTVGTLTVDGQLVEGHAKAWQRNIGAVSQTAFLVDDTIRRNIALGLSDQNIDEDRVVDALTQAQLWEFIDSLPDGLDTPVGERGVRLSGGQRQRIAIARALYRNPAVLVFDEGTSALDNITENELMKTLEEVHGDRTMITVAHRLSTVRNCDRIIVVEGGQITGIGPFDTLAETHPFFRAAAE